MGGPGRLGGGRGRGSDAGKGQAKGRGRGGGRGQTGATEPLGIKESRVELAEESREEVLELIHQLMEARGDAALEDVRGGSGSDYRADYIGSGSSDGASEADGPTLRSDVVDGLEGREEDGDDDDREEAADEDEGCENGDAAEAGSASDRDGSPASPAGAAKPQSAHRRRAAQRRLLQRLMAEDRHRPHEPAPEDTTGKVRIFVCEASATHRRPKGPLLVPRAGPEVMSAVLKKARQRLGIKGKKDLSAYLVSPAGQITARLSCTADLADEQVVAISLEALQVPAAADFPAAAPLPDEAARGTAAAAAAGAALDAVRAAYVRRAEGGARAARALAPLTADEAARLNEELAAHAQAYASEERFRPLREARAALPAARVRGELLVALEASQVVLVVGATGSGKSTQCPNFLLEAATSEGRGAEVAVLCAQPRRIAAASVAERVARERGEEPGDVVGHAVRLDSRASWRTRLLFCTTGVLLQRLNVSPNLAGITHVVVDEAHERSLHTDFLLLLLREVLDRRADLRVIVMSATLERGLFARYFEGFAFDPSDDLPVVRVEGRTFPLTIRYVEEALRAVGRQCGAAEPRGGGASERAEAGADAELEAWVRRVHGGGGSGEREVLVSPAVTTKPDYELIADLCAAILRGNLGPPAAQGRDNGAVLIFLPGYVEIDRCMRALRDHAGVGDRAWILPLHGSMPISQQHRVFQRPPEQGVRKIVVATNVAETSITIDDVTHVIDSGHVRETRYDPRSLMQVFSTAWVSAAAADQRAGRASRSRPGVCWRLYDRRFLETSLPRHTLCEMRRTALEELVLQLRLLEATGDAGGLLQKAPEPPAPEAVAAAVRSLVSIGALGDSPGLPLTPLGFHLAHMPVDARTGKMLIYGALCRCLGPVLTIAACLAHRSPFARGFGRGREERQRRAREETFGHLCSDHLAVVAAYDAYQGASARGGPGAVRQLCDELGLSSHALDGMAQLRRQFLLHLADTGFVEASAEDGGAQANARAGDWALVRCVLCAGLFPNAAQVQRQGGKSILVSRERERCAVHPMSLNCGHQQDFAANSGWLLYHSKVKTSQIFLHDSTLVGSIPLLLFGGDLQVNKARTHVVLDGLLFRTRKPATATLLRLLRQEIDRLLLLKVADPAADLSQTAAPLLTTVARLLRLEGARATGLYGS